MFKNTFCIFSKGFQTQKFSSSFKYKIPGIQISDKIEITEYLKLEHNKSAYHKNDVITGFTQLIDNYLLDINDEKPTNKNEEISKITNKFFSNIIKEEIFKEKSKELELLRKLEAFVENCIKYNKLNYLDSEYFLKNPNFSFILDNYTLENEFQISNTRNKRNIVMSELKVKNKYQEILDRKESIEPIPNSIEKFDTEATYKYFNYLAELEHVREKIELEKNANVNSKLIEEASNEKLLTNQNNDNLKLSDISQKILIFDKVTREKDIFKQSYIEGKRQFYIDEILVQGLKPYPGSKNGPNPQDDPEYFNIWLKQNHDSKIIRALERLYRKDQPVINTNKKNDDEIDEEKSPQKSVNSKKIDEEGEKFLDFHQERAYTFGEEFIISDDSDFDPGFYFPTLKVMEDFIENNKNSHVIAPEYMSKFKFSLIPPKLNQRLLELYHDFFQWNRLTHHLNLDHMINNELNKKIDIKLLEAKNRDLNISSHEKFKNNFINNNVLPILNLYPDSVKNNVGINNIMQKLSKNNPYIDFKFRLQFLDMLAYIIFDWGEKESKIFKSLIQKKPYPATIKNYSRFVKVDWKAYAHMIQFPQEVIGELSESDDEEGMAEAVSEAVVEEQLEEMERAEKKKQEAREKRAEEDAKNAGKEAYEEYKKKVAEEKKKQEEEELQREQAEFEREMALMEREEIENSKKKIEFDEEIFINPHSNINNEIFDERGVLKFGANEVDNYTFYNKDDFVGEDKMRKHLIKGGLPKLLKNEIKVDEKRKRYFELHEKMIKLIISPQEEAELLEILNTKTTNPEYYCYITGIPFDQITVEQIASKTFKQNMFTNDAQINISDAELKLLEKGFNIEKEKEEDDDDEEDIENMKTDFYVPDIPDLNNSVNPYSKIPIDFYDNDDGFWDDYIEEKNKINMSLFQNKPFSTFPEFMAKKIN